MYADFLDLTKVRVELNLPVHFRHLLPSDFGEHESVFEDPEPKFYFNCFERGKIDHSLPLDLRTELVMRLAGADIVRMDLQRNLTERSVGVKPILIPTGYEKHFPIVSWGTLITVIFSFIVIYRAMDSYQMKEH